MDSKPKIKILFTEFTDEEQSANSQIRRKWFDVPEDSLPPVFYLALRSSLTGAIDNGDLATSVAGRVARYERVARRHYPNKFNHLDVYEYKGDEFR